MPAKPEEFRRMDERRLEPRQIALFYGLWILSIVLSILDWVALRAAISTVTAAIVNAIPIEFQIQHQWYARWTARAADPCAIAILTVLAFASIIVFDFVYREAIWKGTIKRTFGVVTAVQVGIAAVCWLAIAVSSRLV
jgi:hypothetical protein